MAIGGIDDSQITLNEIAKHSAKAKSDVAKRMADAEDDAFFTQAMFALGIGGRSGVGFGMPCAGCTLGGGMGFFC